MTATSTGTTLRSLPSVLLTATRLVWGASRVRVVLLVAVQVVSALSLLGSVLLIDRVLEIALRVGRGEAGVADAVLPVALLAALSTATTLAVGVTNLQQRVLGELVERAVWRDLLRVSQAVDLRSFDDPAFYDQAARVEAKAAWQTRVVVQALVMLVGDALGIVAGTVAVVALAPVLAPLLLLSGVPLLLVARLSGRREFRFAVEQSQPSRERAYLQDVLTHRHEAQEVRAFSLYPRLLSSWESNYASYLDQLRRHVSGLVRLSVTGGVASAVLVAAAMVLALLLVARGDLDISSAGAALVAVRLLGGRVSSASRALTEIFEGSFFLQDMQDFLARAPDRDGEAKLPAAPLSFDELRVTDVGFTYPDAAHPALDGVSLRIRRGEVVALVGANGSGKTSLAKLLAGLYQPDSGAIEWDGVDLRQYDVESVRRRIAVMFQDFARYRFTARDNIALGSVEHPVDDAAVHEAAVRASADEFLRTLPSGYLTVLSKEYAGGTELSLGQWQRVALARAFVRDAPLVLLDEPSASLDAQAEHDLFRRIRELFVGRTVVLVSHRFSTVRMADRIVVLAQGKVIEQGDHRQLMSSGGVYAQMFSLQASGYADALEAGTS